MSFYVHGVELSGLLATGRSSLFEVGSFSLNISSLKTSPSLGFCSNHSLEQLATILLFKTPHSEGKS